ncbi:MAG: carbon starvation protein A, partial [Chloroflexi bacterium]|nr:carbon starvation protein A [Chloroflexota bacterium]
MNSLLALVVAIIVAYGGYVTYGKWLDRRIMKTDPKRVTPARMYMDGVDFSPANRNVLFGYQFKSIAATGPVTGAIIAAQWGWLPALLWLLFGVLLIGWLHDYGSTMIAVRSDGQTFGGLSYRLISPRARIILLSFIYFYLLIIAGAFGNLIARTMTDANIPLGIIVVGAAGLLAGQMIYRWKQDIILTTVITAGLSMVGIWLGTLPGVVSLFAAIPNDPK